MANIDSNGVPIGMIVVTNDEGIIGVSDKNEMPLRLPPFDTDKFYTGPFRKEDMNLFKQETAGATLNMGRNTMYSLGRVFPFPGRVKDVPTEMPRTSSVISRTYSKDELVEKYDIRTDRDFKVFGSLEESLQATPTHATSAMIIGGAPLYNQGYDFADYIKLTLVNEKLQGDVKIKGIPSCFELAESVDPFQGTQYQERIHFQTYRRK